MTAIFDDFYDIDNDVVDGEKDRKKDAERYG